MIDIIDQSIVDQLSQNARKPFMTIAKELGVSESTVRKRVHSLENRGIIQKYSLIVDHAKMGFDNVTLMGVDAFAEKYFDVAKKLQDVEEVTYACSSAGDHMFMLKIVTKNAEHLSLVSQKIRSIDGVTRICPAIIKETLKGEL